MMVLKKIISLAFAFLISVLNLLLPVSQKKAEKLVSKMTLEQKIGQMIMPAFRTWDGEGVTSLNDDIRGAIKKYGFGGIILFAENCKGTEQTAKLISDLQDSAETKMLIAVDQEGGSITRLATGTRTCGNMALGALNSKKDTKAMAKIIASELYAEGFNVDFAPDLDVNNNPSNPVIGIRSFSSSPETAANLGKAFIDGMHSENIATAVKHFPGHGDTETDSHSGLPCIDKTYDQLKELELVPFNAGIEAGTDLVMTAHIQYPEIETTQYKSISTGEDVYLPATLSETIITDILRGDMGFEGVVVTDAMNMDAIAKHFNQQDAAVLAVNAGVDILLMPVNAAKKSDLDKFDSYIKNIADAVKEGRISEDRITESAVRIMNLKLKRSILCEDGITVEKRVSYAKKIVGSYKNHEKEFEVAEKAITLVKNDDNLLPLKNSSSENIPVFYPYAGEEVSIEFAIQRLDEKLKDGFSSNVTSYCYRDKTCADFTNEIENASVIVVCSEIYSQSYIGSSGWQPAFIDELIATAHSLGKKVVLLSMQLPYDIARYPSADAIMLCYNAKDMKTIPTVYEGEVQGFGVNIPALICVMFNESSPKGKLPVDVYELDEDSKYTSTVLYDLGYGLSY